MRRKKIFKTIGITTCVINIILFISAVLVSHGYLLRIFTNDFSTESPGISLTGGVLLVLSAIFLVVNAGLILYLILLDTRKTLSDFKKNES